MLSASLRRYEDPAHSADPRIRELVVALATLDPAPAPRAHFRAELRAQLVAVAPRLIAEGPAIEQQRPANAALAQPQAAPTRRAKVGVAAGWTTRISIGRPLATITAVIAIFAMLLGGAVWVSKKALPGDTLYALKRANENVRLSTANGDAAKGKVYLSLAKTRADEVEALLSRSSAIAPGAGPSAATGVNAHTAKLITSTLGLADTEVRNAAQLLGGQAVRHNSADSLSIMTGWAPGQIQRLQSITDRLGSGATHDRALASTRLAAAALLRAQRLNAMLGCNSLDSAATDELGPVPGTVCTTNPAKQSTAPSAPNPSRSTKHRNTATHPRVTGATGSRPSGSLPLPSDPVSVSVPGTHGKLKHGKLKLPPLPPIRLPSLPIHLPTHPGTGSPAPTPTCIVHIIGICIGQHAGQPRRP